MTEDGLRGLTLDELFLRHKALNEKARRLMGVQTLTYLSIAEARAQLDALVERTASGRERIALTSDDRIAAILINPEELAALED